MLKMVLETLGLSTPKRPEIFHGLELEITDLNPVPDGFDFIREGSGASTIGSIGQDVTITVRGTSSLTITGNIARRCRILKEGSGSLEIRGAVADDLKVTVYGTGSVSFLQRPPEFVIRTIKNQGAAAQIIIAGEQLPQQRNAGYVHHNLGIFAPAPAVEPTPRLPPIIHQTPPAPQVHMASPVASSGTGKSEAVDLYDPFTAEYIESYRKIHSKSVKERIEALNLTPKEEPMFEIFCDCIMADYFDDVPVLYHEKYYNLSTLLELYRLNKPDPYSRKLLKLEHIQSARSLLEELDVKIAKLYKNREAAAAEQASHEQPEAASLSM